MEIIQNGESLSCKNVLALGDFDGVHLGHRKLLETTVQIAGHSGARSGVYTFRVNTKKLLGTENFSLLTTETEKNEIFASFGFDFVCADDFNAVKNFSPEQFVSYLAGRFSPIASCAAANAGVLVSAPDSRPTLIAEFMPGTSRVISAQTPAPAAIITAPSRT